MNKLPAAVLAAIAVVGATFAIKYTQQEPDIGTLGANSALPNVDGVGATVDAVGDLAVSSTGRRAQSAVVVSAFSNIPKTRAGLPLKGDPFGASSPEEQRWLDRNGYPNEQQWMAYKTANMGLIAQAAEAGDPVARVELDTRRLIAGDKVGRDNLMNAAVKGSQYALEMLASYLAGSKSGDAKSAYMLYRYGEMRGNIRLGVPRESLVPRLSPVQRLEAEAAALKLYQTTSPMQGTRSGPGANLVDPRPIGSNG